MADRIIDSARLIPNITSSTQPVVMRARMVHQIVRQVNENTLRIKPPSSPPIEQVARTPEQAAQLTAAIVTNPQVGTIIEGVEPSANPLFGSGEQWTEIRRTTESVRVYNPDDETQYVDVDRIESMLFLKSNGETASLFFDNPAVAAIGEGES